MNTLGVAYRDSGKLDLALPLSEETLQLTKATLGPEHPHTLTSMNTLAGTYLLADKLDLALPLFEETLKLRKATLGPEHPNTLTSMNDLALAYDAAGKLDLALPLFEETLKLRKATLGPEHPETLTSMQNLARAYRGADKLDLALPLFVETLQHRKAKLGTEHSSTLTSMASLARAYRAAGKPEQALPLFLQAANGIEKRKFLHVHAGPILGEFIACYEQLNQYAEAEEWRRKWLAVLKERAGADSPAYAEELAALGGNLLKQQKWTDAEPVLRDCLTLPEKVAGAENPQVLPWQVANVRSMLGQALTGQEKYAEAESLLLAGYEGLKEHEATIPPQSKIRLAEALKRLVEFYAATGQAERADEWRKKLEETKAAKETPKP
jgi:tetratricopeptide (TPR) repeat protein